MDLTQTTRCVSRFEPLLYVPSFNRRIFTTSTQDLPQRNLHRGITTLNLEYTTPLSNTITSTQEGQGTKPNHNHLYTRGIGKKPKHNHLYTREIDTKPKLNHLYTKSDRHKAKS